MPDPLACDAAVAALEHDPFYRAIAIEHADDDARHAMLARYFACSIDEARRIGRVVDLGIGLAVWLLPQPAAIELREAAEKRARLCEILGVGGVAMYERIVDDMTARAASIVPEDAWYLSIVAVAPSEQRRGLGRRLLAPTLAEADAVGAVCYLETFDPGNIAFYERLGFATRARFDEPTVGAPYTIMIREPQVARLHLPSE